MEKPNVKAVFFDVDGTLLSHRTGRIPDSARETVLRLHEAGVLLFLSTGRHISEIRKLPGVLGFPWDGLVTLNGACCTDGRAAYHMLPLETEDVRALIREAGALGVPCKFVEEDRLYVDRHTDVVSRVQRDIHTELPPLGDLSHGLSHPVCLVVTYCAPDTQEKLMAHMPASAATNWHPFAFDVVNRRVSKENGIRETCRRFGIPMDATMAFGDGDNDAGMLRCVRFGVAMGNASEKARAAAPYLTEDIDEDGIARAVRRFGLLPRG